MTTSNSWREEVVDAVRAASGGMLFGIPLLYTMEVWWVGSVTSPERLLVILGLTLVPVLLLNHTSGFRSTRDVRLLDALMDSVEAVAIGIVCAAAVLLLLGELNSTTSLSDALGKVVYEATPFAIGVALAHHFLRRNRSAPDDDEGGGNDDREPKIAATLADIGATLIGAAFVALNIAPTDEVPVIGATMDPSRLLMLLAASLVVSYFIVFVAGFANQEQRHAQKGVLQHPLTETFACYITSLGAAALMLWFFQRASLSDPLGVTLTNVVVLGLPAAVGGAAGRLAV